MPDISKASVVVVLRSPEISYAARNLQTAIYALATYPSEEGRSTQVPGPVLAASETSSGLYESYAHQVGMYVLARGMTERRELRAWTFTQDDHDFYVLQLMAYGTMVFDHLTKQWAKWNSPDKAYWRGSDGVEWEGYNLCCDPISNVIWRIDASKRLDYDTTIIISQATAMLPVRLRQVLPCYAGELVVSQASPSDDGANISMRFTDDGITYFDAGTITGEALGESTLFRWYGLGQMGAPGRIFEITNNGYARRIDSFDISVGQEGE